MRSSITITDAKDLKRHSIGEMDTTRVAHAENNQIRIHNFAAFPNGASKRSVRALQVEGVAR